MPSDNLASSFPRLPFAKDADLFLEHTKMSRVDVCTQLREREIGHVEIKPLISAGGIRLDGEGRFIISLNTECPLLEKAETLGHEIAHTFKYDLNVSPPKSCYDPAHITDEMYCLIEDFCDEFSKRWLQVNDRGDILLRIENTMKLIQ